MYSVYEFFAYTIGEEDLTTVYDDVYLAGPFASREEAEEYIDGTDPDFQGNLIVVDEGEPPQ